MDNEKAYNEALERARRILCNIPEGSASARDIETIFPELRESEDEKIRKFLIDYFTSYKIGNVATKLNGYRIDDILAYLEKQKEQHLELKAGKWYICHRAFCARADHLTVKEGERFQCEKDGIVKGFVIKEPEKYFKECSTPEPMEAEQKPAEWSEEDEDKLYRIIETLLADKEVARRENPQHYDVLCKAYDELIAWLKFLRPQGSKDSLQTHWKPSEEQMDVLLNTEGMIRASGYPENAKVLASLYEALKKL